MQGQTPANPVLTFRPGPDLGPELAARGGADSGLVRRELLRYYAALAAELKTVALSEAEALLLCDSLNGVLIAEPPEMVRLLWANVDDAVRADRLDGKWNVDGPALVEKLRGLSFAQSLAVADAVERAWELLPEAADNAAVLRRVGLVR